MTAFDMAQMLRDGHTLPDIAATFGLSARTVQDHVRTSGWSWRTGQPLDTSGYEPDPRPAAPSNLFVDQPWADQAPLRSNRPRDIPPRQGRAPPARPRRSAPGASSSVWGGHSERERRAISNGTATTCPDCGQLFYGAGYNTHQRAHRLDKIRAERTGAA